MMIPTDIAVPKPRRGRILGRMAENALFWTVLVLLGLGAVTSFYYEEQITAAAPDTAQTSVMKEKSGITGSGMAENGIQEQRILRYQMDGGQLTVYP